MTVVLASPRTNAVPTPIRLEGLVVDFAVELAETDADQIEARLGVWLEQLAELARAELVTLLRFRSSAGDQTPTQISQVWGRPQASAVLSAATWSSLPGTLGKLRAGELVSIDDLDQLPADLLEERALYERLEFDSLVALPVVVGGAPIGALVLGWPLQRPEWFEPQTQGLRAMAALFGGALSRLRAEGESAPAAAQTPTLWTLADVDRAHILTVLRACNWVVAGPRGAAKRLGMKRSTLNFRMQKLGIARERP